MVYDFNGKKIKIPKEYIDNNCKLLDITEDECIQMYLEDEGYLDNVEQMELCEKAKTNKVTNLIQASSKAPNERKKREVVKKENPDKKHIIDIVYNALCKELDGNFTVNVSNDTKLIEFEYHNKHFKLDLVEKREKKDK